MKNEVYYSFPIRELVVLDSVPPENKMEFLGYWGRWFPLDYLILELQAYKERV